jgi:hypothetical protein
MNEPDCDECKKNKAARYIPLVKPSSLTNSQRQMLWHGIKKCNPDLAECLKNDINIKYLKENFGACVVFTAEEINDYVMATISKIK